MECWSWRLNREPVLHSLKRYQLQFSITFALLLFSLLSTWILMSICFLLSPFYQAPSCFRAILCKPIGLITPGLSVLIAVLVGQGLNYFPVGRLSPAWITWKRCVTTSPKVIASLILPLLFIPIHFGGWISTHKTSPGNGWVFVQRKVKGRCAFQQGSPFRVSLSGISFADCPCSLKPQYSVFPWCQQCAWEHGPISVTYSICYSLQWHFLLLLAGIF